MRFEAFYIQYLNIKQINYMFVEEFVCGCIRILDDISLKMTEFVLFNFLDSSQNTRISNLFKTSVHTLTLIEYCKCQFGVWIIWKNSSLNNYLSTHSKKNLLMILRANFRHKYRLPFTIKTNANLSQNIIN